MALEVRFGGPGHPPAADLGVTLSLPVIWLLSMALAGCYDLRFIGLGSDEFRRVMNAAAGLTAGLAVLFYATKLGISRGYMVLALPSATLVDLAARYGLRKRLHRLRSAGLCLRRVVAVGHDSTIADLVTLLRRDSHHGMTVVAACVAGVPQSHEVEGIPVCGGLDDVAPTVSRFGADTVAVLACPELCGVRLRELAWDLEMMGTELCVAPALLDVAGPRTTIRPVAGLPLLHMDHPELVGGKRVIKAIFDRASAVAALVLLAPLFAAIAAAILVTDRRPVFFRQTRVGKDGSTFSIWKFRTMIVDAEERKRDLLDRNEAGGVLFKMRRDPRVTMVGRWLRRWSLDELPQLFNVLLGEMSLVGPRPALPAEAAAYGCLMARRLVVKPGITGLWQVNGRSDLSWDDTVRLDLRYVENWSLALDLQILWKTLSAVVRGVGAY